MPLATGTILQNRYRIVKLIGQGGFGAVYRGWDLSLEQPVAVKENFGSDAESQRQFEREAKLLAGLRHPNLPRVIDHFVLPGQGQYLVMDFVEGQSLGALLAARGGPLAEAEALPWMRQVCDALTYLHGRTPPIIHRDIKPENIIITAEGRAMLVDFGISKVYDPSKGTTIGAKAVTPGYSPPEQYGRGRTDGRSDVYSLAATLYTLLTGQTPPEAPDLSSGADVLTPPRQVNRAVSKATSETIMAAMALSMSLRLGDAAAFERQLPAPPPVPPPPVAPRPVAPRSVTPPPVVQQPTLPVASPAPAAPAGSTQTTSSAPVWVWLLGIAAIVALAVWAGLWLEGRGSAGQATVSAGQISDPAGIAVDASGNVYVTDTLNHRVQRFTADGVFLNAWGSAGSDEGQFHGPWGIAVAGDGTVYVADRDNNRVQQFSAGGEFLNQWGSYGSDAEQFNDPQGIAVAGDGTVYVADSFNHRIQQFSAGGEFLKQWGGEGSGAGQFLAPYGIAVAGDGTIYVADTNNHRVQQFTADGVFLNAWGSAGSGAGRFNDPQPLPNVVSPTSMARAGSGAGRFNAPQGIAVAGDGTVYVADTGNHRVQQFTAGGESLNAWGSEGGGDGQFSYPQGIAVAGDGTIYVADRGNHRIQLFTPDGEFVAWWGRAD